MRSRVQIFRFLPSFYKLSPRAHEVRTQIWRRFEHRAFRWHKMASLECKGNSLKVKWSHTVSVQSRHICAHEEVRELNPFFQIDT